MTCKIKILSETIKMSDTMVPSNTDAVGKANAMILCTAVQMIPNLVKRNFKTANRMLA